MTYLELQARNATPPASVAIDIRCLFGRCTPVARLGDADCIPDDCAKPIPHYIGHCSLGIGGCLASSPSSNDTHHTIAAEPLYYRCRANAVDAWTVLPREQGPGSVHFCVLNHLFLANLAFGVFINLTTVSLSLIVKD